MPAATGTTNILPAATGPMNPVEDSNTAIVVIVMPASIGPINNVDDSNTTIAMAAAIERINSTVAVDDSSTIRDGVQGIKLVKTNSLQQEKKKMEFSPEGQRARAVKARARARMSSSLHAKVKNDKAIE
ncbi:hypothetical protein AgCh_034986 [Apium graveolens]